MRLTKKGPAGGPTRDLVLGLLEEEHRPLHAREIAARLGLREGDYSELLRLLDDMSYEGVLGARPGQRFKLSTKTAESRGAEREGTIAMHPRGFGFVRLADAGASGEDVFVPPEAIGGAMHGDRVVVRVRARGARGPEGEVARVVERSVTRVAGTLHRRGKSAWLEPDDTRVRGPIPLPEDVDRQGPEGNSGRDGDAVVVALTRYPELPDEQPVGRIEAVLGRPGELSVEIAKILVLERIEEVHSKEAFAEAAAFGDSVPAEMMAGREDLRHLPLPTIDPEDARDHDDAVWVERTEEGGYRAWVAIADVSAYVTPGTHLDKEALARGCSVYLPDRAIPMLPRPLSSNLCSLLPGVDRLCLCVELELDPGGKVMRSWVVRGVMRSRAKLHYGGVARALGLTETGERQTEADAMMRDLRVAYELSRKLRTRRMKRGALDFELPEAKIVLDPKTGEPVDVVRRAQDEGTKRAYQLIEELMLLANEEVAQWIQQRGLAAIYRVHAPPDEAKLDRFLSMCDTLGIHCDPEATRDPKKLSELLKSFSGHPLAPVLNSLLLRSMKQATYDVENVGHFGLASPSYLHFTSPIRRYPDLVVHRIVHAALLERPPAHKEKLAEAAFASSTSERRAMEVERAVVDLHRAYLMKSKVGERFEGTVTAVVGSGAFAALDAPFVDVLMRLEDMGQDNYEIDEDKLRIVGRRSGDAIELGDRVVVEVTDASIARRTVYAKRLGGKTDGRRDGKQGSRRDPKRSKAEKKRVDRKVDRAVQRNKKARGKKRRPGT